MVASWTGVGKNNKQGIKETIQAKFCYLYARYIATMKQPATKLPRLETGGNS